ncbi:MAG: LemA family protein [Bacteroidetes bacterium]|nr:LemA family protein [Bacteroidota bacterium]
MSNKLAIGIVAVLLVLMVGCGYNGLNKLNQDVNEKWAKVESAYQNRADLIPNLAKTVKSYANFEQETLIKVQEARSKATSITINPGELTAEKMAEFQAAQNQLSSTLSKLMAVVENYPDLKAIQSYQDFMHQYEGVENKIRYARDQYNVSAKEYNVRVNRFPTVMYSRILGFKERPFFKSDAGSENAPDVGDNLP